MPEVTGVEGSGSSPRAGGAPALGGSAGGTRDRIARSGGPASTLISARTAAEGLIDNLVDLAAALDRLGVPVGRTYVGASVVSLRYALAAVDQVSNCGQQQVAALHFPPRHDVSLAEWLN